MIKRQFSMKPLTVLITAGPTQEPLDPIRYLTNPSSGEMGLALAQAFQKKGASVILVCGPTSLMIPTTFRHIPVRTAIQMHRVVMTHLPRCDVFVATAAVSDWRFKKVQPRKIKKGSAKEFKIPLIPNPDILFDAGRWKKRQGGKRPLLVGFALETNQLRSEAKKKMIRKNCDLMIGNTPASFASDRIKPLWMERHGQVVSFQPMTKSSLASHIVSWVEKRAPLPRQVAKSVDVC
ncbi:MAG: hypothetical protein LHV69_07375 [Elusimicrobia bacterium]|nr:hypothetical protein [Candidatus Obscuribacterium magneticum]